MKKIILAVLIALYSIQVFAQDIKLPSPNLKQKSMSVVDALNNRHSVRSFDKTRKLSEQEISNLCWAACGVNRKDKRRTAPTALNKQEIRLYLFSEKGVYEYLANENVLKSKAKGDYRHLLVSNDSSNKGKGFKQDFVLDAPISLIMVIDFDLFGREDDKAMQMGCVDAGNVSENINIYCEAAKLATVPRATMDQDAIIKLLGLNSHQLPIINNPVGYEKK